MTDLSGKQWTAGEGLGSSHRTDHNNLATVDARVARMELERGRRNGAICISWDDAYVEKMVAGEEAAERNQRHTFYIATSLVGSGAAYLTEANILELVDQGHEIGAHTVSHDSYVDDLTTPAERAADMDACKSYLEDLIQKPVTSFAYTYGDRNSTIDREVYGRFWNAAGVTQAGRPLWLPDWRPFLFYREFWTSARQGSVLESVRLCADQPSVVHLYNHQPGIQPTLSELRAVLDLADELGVAVVGASEVMATGPNLRNPLPDGTADGWHPVTSGTGSVTVQAGTPPSGTAGSAVFRMDTADASSFAFYRQPVSFVPGRTYSLSALARKTITSGDDSSAVQVRVAVADSDSVTLSNTSDGLTTDENDGEWVRLQADVTIPQNAAFVDVDLLLLNGQGFAEFCHVAWDETRFGSFGG